MKSKKLPKKSIGDFTAQDEAAKRPGVKLVKQKRAKKPSIYDELDEMDEFGNQLSYKRFNKAGKITSQDVSQYNEFHLLTSIAYKEKYFSLMEYTYY